MLFKKGKKTANKPRDVTVTKIHDVTKKTGCLAYHKMIHEQTDVEVMEEMHTPQGKENSKELVS